MLRHWLLVHVGTGAAVVLGIAIPASIAVVIRSLWSSLTTDLGHVAALQLVLGALPSTVYLVAPFACAAAICWLFRLNSENDAIPALYAAGVSVVRCAAPALLFALFFALASIANAWFLAPRGVTMVEDVKHDLEVNFDIGSLRASQFHTMEFDESVATLYFRKNDGGGRLEGVFLVVAPRGKDRFAISAAEATVLKGTHDLKIHFAKGTWLPLDAREKEAAIQFTSYTHAFDTRSARAGSARRGKTLLEMGHAELVARVRLDLAQRKPESKALSELAKRWLVPFMSLSHSLLAIGLLFAIGPARVVSRGAHLWVAGALLLLHVLALATVELVVRGSSTAPFVVAAAIVLEALAGWRLLERSNRTLRRPLWLDHLRHAPWRAEPSRLGP
jgi:lipopolysaccharide export LptBFGC system permease protein LptF